MVCKTEWHNNGLFPSVGFIVTNSTLRAWQVVRGCDGRANLENRIKEANNTLCRDKSSCHRFEGNQARLKIEALDYSLLHMIREPHLPVEDQKRSRDWLIRRIVKADSRVYCIGRRW